MNGQIAFAKTLRALDEDSSHASKLSIVLAIVTLAGWIWWMLTPSVAQYEEVATNVHIFWISGSNQAVLNGIQASDYHRIHTGQSVRLRFDGQAAEARVYEFRPSEDIVLNLRSNIVPPFPSRANLDIETARISPARIVLRALQ